MPIFETYSMRLRRQSGMEQNEVFRYENPSKKLRNQICQICDEALGIYGPPGAYEIPDSNQLWEYAVKTIRKELGVFQLSNANGDLRRELFEYILNANGLEFIDALEIICITIMGAARVLKPFERRECGILNDSGVSIDEINERMRADGFGFEFAPPHMIRVDSKYVHAQAVVPALKLLSLSDFEGANEEFHRAFQHYKDGHYGEAIVNANNAFESTMKTICKLCKWEYPAGASAANLISIIRNNGLIEDYIGASLEQFSALMKSGLPKLRNEGGAHGQGPERKDTPDFLASYALNLAATKMLFLLSAYQKRRKR